MRTEKTMSKTHEIPMTPGIRQLKSAGVEYTASQYAYEEHGGTEQCSRELGIDEHRVIKTIVLKSAPQSPFIVLMHGDREISLKQLARILNLRAVEQCTVQEAQKFSGYFVGGISPFGFRRKVPIYAQKTIFDLDWIVINGGARGLFVRMSPEVIRSLLSPKEVDVARDE